MNLVQRMNLGQTPLFLMDGTAFIYRGFYANRHLRRSDGFPTNALVLVARLLLKIIREEKPKFLLFAMDGKGKNFRHEIYDQYKANREAMPEDLVVQIEPVKQLVEALGLPLHVTNNYEADDCIASLASRFAQERPVAIISGDKDLKQCLGENIFMWDPAGKEEKIFTMADFEAEMGIPPAVWPDMQALIGDTSDNIPGVPGIGPKTAIQIFAKCPNLESIREHLDRLPQKIQEKLAPHLEEMFRWRRLARLKTDVCLDLDLEDLRVRPINAQSSRQLAKEYEMSTVGKEILALADSEKPQIAQQAPLFAQQELVGQAVPEGIEAADASLLPDCAGQAVAIVPDGKLWVACQGAQQERDFVWMGKTADLCRWLAQAEKIIVPALKPLVTASESWLLLVEKTGIGRFADLGLASYLLDPEAGDYSWPRISAAWRETLDDAAGAPASFALKMEAALANALETGGLLPLYRNIEMPLVLVLAEMEKMGFAIDPAAFQSFLKDVSAETEKLSEEIYQEVGEKFNIRSSMQLGEILFNKLGLNSGKKTRSGRPSTSELALEKLADNPVVAKVLQYRKFDKMQSTYLEPLPRLMDAHDRIHTTFNQEATATGRISSSNPNLQNIPVRGPLGARMRACFVPAPGCLLLAADYSQIELRVLAHLSRDENLLEAFHKQEDIHARTAALVFEETPDKITPDQRRMAKTINFGLLYGMGARKLAAELRIPEKDASAFIQRYFARLSGLKEFYEKILEGARSNGYVTTMSGRRRWLPGLASANGQIQAQAERQAVNAVIQGTAADIIKMAMLDVAHDSRLAAMNARLVLQVHDELLLEAPEEVAREACALAASLMETVRPGGVELLVPLAVDWGVGKNWAEAH